MFLLLLMAHVVLSFIWTYYFFYFMGSLSSKQQYAKLIQKGSSIPIYQWQTYWNRNQESNLFSNFVKNILNKSNSGNISLLYWKFKVTRQYFDEDTTRWKDLPCSCVPRNNITKMVSTQSNLPIQCNSDQNSNVILTEIQKTILKIIWKHKRSRQSKQFCTIQSLLDVSPSEISSYNTEPSYMNRHIGSME